MTKAEREEQKVVLERLRRDAVVLASAFRLPLQGLDAEGPRVKRRYGVCYSDGCIRIRLRHVRTGQLLKYSGLVDTLCHELAHLRHFNHGVRFQNFYRGLLGYARRVGIYRPDPRRRQPGPSRRVPRAPSPSGPVPRPRQLDLFDSAQELG